MVLLYKILIRDLKRKKKLINSGLCGIDEIKLTNCLDFLCAYWMYFDQIYVKQRGKY